MIDRTSTRQKAHVYPVKSTLLCVSSLPLACCCVVSVRKRERFPACGSVFPPKWGVCAHRREWESDWKASVSSHVHYTHSLWQQKGKKGLAVAHTAGGLSRGCLGNTHTRPKNTRRHTEADPSLRCFDDAREASQHGGHH